jgi:hypothetical protein
MQLVDRATPRRSQCIAGACKSRTVSTWLRNGMSSASSLKASHARIPMVGVSPAHHRGGYCAGSHSDRRAGKRPQLMARESPEAGPSPIPACRYLRESFTATRSSGTTWGISESKADSSPGTKQRQTGRKRAVPRIPLLHLPDSQKSGQPRPTHFAGPDEGAIPLLPARPRPGCASRPLRQFL